MNKKIITFVIISFLLIVCYILCWKKDKEMASLTEENIMKVEEFLSSAGEVDIMILQSDVKAGTQIEYVYNSPKKIELAGYGICEVNLWKVVESGEQFYILVSCGENVYTYHFPQSMLDEF